MSESLALLPELHQAYKNGLKQSQQDATGIWDELLNLIAGVVQKILDTSIGANGQTIGTLINGIKTGITGSIDNLHTWIKGVTDSITTNINGLYTQITNSIGSIIDGVTTSVSGIVEGIQDALATVIQSLVDKVASVIDAIKGIGADIGEWISGAIAYIGGWIKTSVSDIINGIKSYLLDVYNTVITTAQNIIQSVKDEVIKVYNAVKTWITDTYNSIKESIERVIQSLKDTYESVKETILTWIKGAWNKIIDGLETLQGWIKGIWGKIDSWWKTTILPNIEAAKKIPAMLKDIAGKIWDFIAKGDFQGLFDTVDNIFKSFGLPAPLEILQGIVSLVMYFYENIRLQFVPLEVAAQKNANISLALDPISLDQAANGVFRGVMTQGEFFYNAALGGVAKSRAQVALETAKPLPTPGQVQQLYLRGEIDEHQHDTILSSYGFSDASIKEIKALYAIIPGVQDIIRMAVREAFTPDIAERFGQYEDLPEVFISWAAKQGLDKDWAARYWAAHWDLPSPNMGFEMFQRRIINKDDLILLLRALDVMPFWREKLIELSYNPLTRVDVRRMYKMGVITEDQVYNAHLDIGYSPDNARLLTEFTKRYSSPESDSQAETFSELARTTYSQAYRNRIISETEYREFLHNLKYVDEDINLLVSLDDYAIYQKEQLFDATDYRKTYMKLITTGYTRGLYNREDAQTILLDLGFDQDQAEMELNLIDYNRQVAMKDVLLQQLHNQYVSYIIEDIDLHTILDTFGFFSDEVDRLIEEWGIERAFRDKRPSGTDLKKFYNEGQLTLDQYLDELRGTGLHEKYISMYQKSLSRAKG